MRRFIVTAFDGDEGPSSVVFLGRQLTTVEYSVKRAFMSDASS